MSGKNPDRPVSDLGAFEARLGYSFRDRGLLDTALRHASSAHETPGTASNERLEFLGDAVMALVVGHLLYEAHLAWEEGDLSRAVQQLVDRPAFAALARQLELGPYLRLGRTEQQSQGRDKDSILANAMEAVVGAVYLDGGLEAARALVKRVYSDALSEAAPPAEGDAKTRFQEAVMARHGEFPRYELEHDSGIGGDQRRFTSVALVEDQAWGKGSGRTKRAAEFAAAVEGLKRLGRERADGE
jgi:ribonuclease-3